MFFRRLCGKNPAYRDTLRDTTPCFSMLRTGIDMPFPNEHAVDSTRVLFIPSRQPLKYTPRPPPHVAKLSLSICDRSGIPFSDVNLSSGHAFNPTMSPGSSLSEATTLQLEFRYCDCGLAGLPQCDRLIRLNKHGFHSKFNSVVARVPNSFLVFFPVYPVSPLQHSFVLLRCGFPRGRCRWRWFGLPVQQMVVGYGSVLVVMAQNVKRALLYV